MFIIPGLGWPIKWYSVLFALGFAIGFSVFKTILQKFFIWKNNDTLPNLAHKLTDQVMIYSILATVIGARLGHFLFYEKPSEYFSDPLELFGHGMAGWQVTGRRSRSFWR
jgi:prolipoprotein diacylglyceryltransferase